MSARDAKLEVAAGADTPGPGAYNAKKVVGLFDKMPSSAFRSSSTQRMKGHGEDTPGVGSYEPKRSAVEPSLGNGGGAGMRGQETRFKAEVPTTDDNLGPGSYDQSASISADLAKSVQRMSRANPGFGSRTVQHELPFFAGASETPGAGSYDPQNPTGDLNSAVKRPSSAFKSASRRLEVEDQGQGDPGLYDPHSSRELAQTTKNSFGRSNRTGAGGFGARSARDAKLEVAAGVDTPGPGAYNAGKAQSEAQKKMPSSAFRSSSTQRMKGHGEDTPGVGSYEPKRSAVEPSLGNGGGAGMRGQETRFKAEVPTTYDNLGPGSYMPEVSVSGVRATMASSASKNAERGGSAVFASDTTRDLY